MSVSILTTVVPIINAKDPNLYHFHVYLTPRISCSGKEALENFPYVYNWVECQDYLRDNITFSVNGVLVKAPNVASVQPIPIKITNDWLNDNGQDIPDADKSKWQFTLWRSMFDRHTRVDGWELDSKPYELATKLSSDDLNKGMNTIILRYKNELMSKSLKELGIPGIFDSAVAERRQKNSLIAMMNHLYNLTAERKLGSPYLNSTSQTIAFPGFLLALRQELNNFYIQRQQEIDDLTLKISLNEVHERNVKETTEFHKKMTAFANFPFLLRQTGWLWELTVKKDLFNNFKGKELFVNCTFSPPTASIPTTAVDAFFDNTDFVPANTYIRITKDSKIDYSFKPQFLYLKVEEGIIKADENFGITINLIEKNEVFERIDSFLKQKYKFEYYKNQPLDGQENQNRISGAAENQLPDRRDELLVLNEERTSFANNNLVAPVSTDYNSSGFSVRLKNLTAAMQQAVSNPPNLTEGIAIVYGHHIHKGYRPDLQNKGVWKSLSERLVFYTIDLKDNEVDADERMKIIPEKGRGLICHEDEGWVVESAQGSNSGKLYVDEDLFRYNDWSISSDKLFYTSEERQGTEEVFINENSRLSISSIPKHKSLPPLRYGDEYAFRMRFVDLCGGGPGVTDSMQNSLPQPFRYERTQGINAPLFYLGQCLHKHGKRQNAYLDETIGQDLQTMVIRAVYNKDTRDLKSDVKFTSIRFVAPPKLDFQLSKKHGVFDSLMIETATNNSSIAIEKSKHFIKLSSLPAKPAEDDLVSDKEEIIKNVSPIDFLFDPLVAGYELMINNLQDRPWMLRSTGTTLTTSDFQNMYYDNVQYMRLSLAAEAASFSNLFDYTIEDESPHSKKISLQQGMEKELQVRCLMLEDLNGKNASALLHNHEVERSLIRVKLVHATQKPCMLHLEIAPGKNFQETYEAEIKTMRRARGGMMVNIELFMPLFPCLTTETYLLHVCYIDLVSNRKRKVDGGSEQGYQLVQISRIIKTGIQPNIQGIEQQVIFSKLEHSFNDTKCRWIYYRLEAVSKFKKYFPADVIDFSVYSRSGNIRLVPVEIEASNKDVQRTTDSNWVNHKNWALIKSSNQPPVLSVDRIVPLIRWEGTPATGLSRVCDTVRVYLEGDWYLTGEDEGVAVFFGNHEDANSSNMPRELDGAFCQFGMDPAAVANHVDPTNIPIINSDFFYFPPGPLPRPILENFIQVKNLDFDNNNAAGQFGNYWASAAIYKVEYMPPTQGEDSGRFYIDVRIAPLQKLQDLYMPFLRLAIARYQPNTEPNNDLLDLRFSHIVLTDYVQLLPYRKLTIGAGKLYYDAPSARHATQENINIITRPGADIPVGKSTNNNLVDPVALAPDEVFPANAELRFSAVPGATIEEYELYDHQDDIIIKPDTPSREDFTKRLIFSYTIS